MPISDPFSAIRRALRPRRAWHSATMRAALLLAAGMQGVLAASVAPDAPLAPLAPPPGTDTFSHGDFSSTPIYLPASAVGAVVLLLRADPTPAAAGASATRALADALRNDGALVALVDVAALADRKLAKGESCLALNGDLENFSRFLQARYRLPGYQAPILLGGDAPGAAWAYALLATAPADVTFAGAISPDLPADLALPAPLCPTAARPLTTAADTGRTAGATNAVSATTQAPSPGRYALQAVPHLPRPWFAGTGTNTPAMAPLITRLATPLPGGTALDTDRVRHAVRDLAAQHVQTGAPPQAVADLPLIELPAPAARQAQDTLATGAATALATPAPTSMPPPPPTSTLGAAPDVLAIMLSGDGGWAGIDREVAEAINAQGIPVVGFDSLRYFWQARTPDSTTHDLARVIRHYQAQPAWHRSRVLLIGYSQGADVLPFVLNRLEAPLRQQVAAAVLLALGPNAAFEFHVSNWIGRDDSDPPTAPEVARLPPGLATCLYGEDDTDSLCATLARDATRGDATPLRLVALKGDHHFDGAYQALARHILAAVAEPR